MHDSPTGLGFWAGFWARIINIGHAHHSCDVKEWLSSTSCLLYTECMRFATALRVASLAKHLHTATSQRMLYGPVCDTCRCCMYLFLHWSDVCIMKLCVGCTAGRRLYMLSLYMWLLKRLEVVLVTRAPGCASNWQSMLHNTWLLTAACLM